MKACTAAELRELYDALTSIGMKPADLVYQLRRQGRKIHDLGQLSSAEAKRHIFECKKYIKPRKANA